MKRELRFEELTSQLSRRDLIAWGKTYVFKDDSICGGCPLYYLAWKYKENPRGIFSLLGEYYDGKELNDFVWDYDKVLFNYFYSKEEVHIQSLGAEVAREMIRLTNEGMYKVVLDGTGGGVFVKNKE